MGRKKLNRTIDEIREQNRIRAKRFYKKHSKKIKEIRMQRYWESKTMDKKMPKM